MDKNNFTAADQLKAVYKELGDLFGSPCNFDHISKYMRKRADPWCEENCCELPESACWQKFLGLKFASLNDLSPIELENVINDAMGDSLSGWIPVTQQLPEINTSVLCCGGLDGTDVFVTQYMGTYFNIKTPVVAWMPLPEPY